MDALLCVGNERFRLRQGRPSDFDAIMQHGEHPESLWLGVPHPCPPERAEKVLAEFARGWEGDFGLTRLVVDHHTDEIIGLVSLARHSSSCVEVSYGVAPGCRGSGLATSILRLVTDRVLRLDCLATRIEAVIDPTNLASIRVVTKVGYAYEGHRRSVVPATGQVCDDLVYVRTSQDRQSAQPVSSMK